MFNKALTVASLFAASSFAAQTPAMDAFKSFASSEENCLPEYMQPCGMVVMCCDHMQCLYTPGEGPGHYCQYNCFFEDGCQNHSANYGELYCHDYDSPYGGRCRQV